MRVYISSSWKNRERVRQLARALRGDAGARGTGRCGQSLDWYEKHSVYDFTDPESRAAVLGEPAVAGAAEIPPERFQEQFDPDKNGPYVAYLSQHPEWRRAVEQNRRAVAWSDCVLLLLPAGCDSHADWALGVGLGKRSAVVGPPRAGDRVPSHLWADAFLEDDLEDVLAWCHQRLDHLPGDGCHCEGFSDLYKDIHGVRPWHSDGDGLRWTCQAIKAWHDDHYVVHPRRATHGEGRREPLRTGAQAGHQPAQGDSDAPRRQLAEPRDHGEGGPGARPARWPHPVPRQRPTEVKL